MYSLSEEAGEYESSDTEELSKEVLARANVESERPENQLREESTEETKESNNNGSLDEFGKDEDSPCTNSDADKN